MKTSAQPCFIIVATSALGQTLRLVGMLALAFSPAGRAADTAAFTSYSAGQADVVVSRDGADFLRFDVAVWGPNWAWTGVQGKSRSENGTATGALTATVAGTPLQLMFRAARTAPNRLELNYELKAEKDAALTLFVVTVDCVKAVHECLDYDSPCRLQNRAV